MEKIRELSILLNKGIDDYEEQSRTVQHERLKFIRLSLTNSFGQGEDDSKESWMNHLSQLGETLKIRSNVLQQAVKNAADEFIKEEKAMSED